MIYPPIPGEKAPGLPLEEITRYSTELFHQVRDTVGRDPEASEEMMQIRNHARTPSASGYQQATEIGTRIRLRWEARLSVSVASFAHGDTVRIHRVPKPLQTTPLLPGDLGRVLQIHESHHGGSPQKRMVLRIRGLDLDIPEHFWYDSLYLVLPWTIPPIRIHFPNPEIQWRIAGPGMVRLFRTLANETRDHDPALSNREALLNTAYRFVAQREQALRELHQRGWKYLATFAEPDSAGPDLWPDTQIR